MPSAELSDSSGYKEVITSEPGRTVFVWAERLPEDRVISKIAENIIKMCFIMHVLMLQDNHCLITNVKEKNNIQNFFGK